MKHATRNDFDEIKVSQMLRADKITPEQALGILDEACHVISGLKHDLGATLNDCERILATRQYWLTGKIEL